MAKINMDSEFKKNNPSVGNETLQANLVLFGWNGVLTGYVVWIVSTIALYYRVELVDYLIDTFKLFESHDGGVELMQYFTLFATISYYFSFFNMLTSALLLIGIHTLCGFLLLPWICYNAVVFVVNLVLGCSAIYFAVIIKSINGFFFVFLTCFVMTAIHLNMLKTGLLFFEESNCMRRKEKGIQRFTLV